MKKILLVTLFVIASLMPFSQEKMCAQDSFNGNVTLIVSGEGSTKEEATKNALRNAIEQAFGTFVSANTKVLDDELIKDEIVTVTSGNIQNYKEVNYLDENEIKTISLQVTVSVGKLVSYAQNKGMSTELSGAKFVYNKRMIELNRRNEYIALTEILPEQLDAISKKGLFNYSITVSEPRNSSTKGYNLINIKVSASLNSNGRLYLKTIDQMMASLSLTDSERKQFRAINEDQNEFFIICHENPDEGGEKKIYNLRNVYGSRDKYGIHPDYVEHIPLLYLFIRSLVNFQIEDNLGNKMSPLFVENKKYSWEVNDKSVIEKTRKEFESSFSNDIEIYNESHSKRILTNYKGKIREFCSTLPLNRYSDFLRGIRTYGNAFSYSPKYEFEIVATYSDSELSKLDAIKILPYNETIQEVEDPIIFNTYKGNRRLVLGTERATMQMCDDDLSTYGWCGQDHPYVAFQPESKCKMSHIALYNGVFTTDSEEHQEYCRIKKYEVYHKNQTTKEVRLLSTGVFEDTPFAQFVDLKDCEIDPKNNEIIFIYIVSIYKSTKINAVAISEAIGYGNQL